MPPGERISGRVAAVRRSRVPEPRRAEGGTARRGPTSGPGSGTAGASRGEETLILVCQLGRGPEPFACPSGRCIETLTDRCAGQCTHADYSRQRLTPFLFRVAPARRSTPSAARNRYRTSLSGPGAAGRRRSSRQDLPHRNDRKRKIEIAPFSLSDMSAKGAICLSGAVSTPEIRPQHPGRRRLPLSASPSSGKLAPRRTDR